MLCNLELHFGLGGTKSARQVFRGSALLDEFAPQCASSGQELQSGARTHELDLGFCSRRLTDCTDADTTLRFGHGSLGGSQLLLSRDQLELQSSRR